MIDQENGERSIDLKFTPLFSVMVATAVATAVAQVWSPLGKVRFAALLLDLVPVGGVALATVGAAIRLRRARASATRVFLGIYGYCVGALIAMLGVAHLAAVIVAALERSGRHQFVYSFRFYSLVLLGVLLVLTGLRAAVPAAHLARGDRAAWRESLLVWTAILAINLPLAPIQGFAVGFSILALIALLLLVGTRRHFNRQPVRIHMPTPTSRIEVDPGGDGANGKGG